MSSAGFLKAADGIRTHDLLHGKRDGGIVRSGKSPAKAVVLGREGCGDSAELAQIAVIWRGF